MATQEFLQLENLKNFLGCERHTGLRYDFIDKYSLDKKAFCLAEFETLNESQHGREYLKAREKFFF